MLQKMQGNNRLREVGITIILTVLVFVLTREYVRTASRRWFSDSLPEAELVRHWTDVELDRRLHKLSRWEEFDSAQFQSFVKHQIRGLGLKKSEEFSFLEVGVGVGAFARYMLLNYPNATGMGIDVQAKAISVAAEVLPRDRFRLLVADMVSLPANKSSFDYVLVPGSLCYLYSLDDVILAVAEFTRVLRPGGGLCVSMLPSATSPMGSCNTRIPKSVWTSAKRLRVVTMEEMNDWNLPHSLGRYSTCLRKSVV